MARMRFATLLMAALAVGCVGSTETTTPSIAYKAAVIDGHAAPDEATVARYEAAFDRLKRRCPEPEERLGDMAVRSRDLLREGGVDESLLSILEHVHQAIPAGADLSSCADVFGSYVFLRRGGS